MKKNELLLIVLMFLVFVGGNKIVRAQQIEGTDFWWVMPSNNTNLGASSNIGIQSNYFANVTVTFPNMTGSYSTQTIRLTPGTQSVVLLGGPQEYVGNQVTGATSSPNIFPTNNWTVENVGVHIMADTSITVYAVNYESASIDAECVLPTSMLGTTYVVDSRSETWPGNEANFTICATQKNTSVNIKTWWNSGGQKDKTVNVTLDAGQTYKCGTGVGGGYDPATTAYLATGSVVTANKPIVVVGHTNCTGLKCGACDMIMTELLPVSAWGTKYVTAQVTKRNALYVSGTCSPLPATTGDYVEIIGQVGQQIHILSTTQNITKTIPALPFATSNSSYGVLWYENPKTAGATSSEPNGEANMELTSTQPFSVVQFQKGWQTDNLNTSDPEAIVVYPYSTWQNNYLMTSIMPVGGGGVQLAVIVVDNTLPNSKNITLDGTPISSVSGASAWQDFAGAKYSYIRAPLANGTATHKIVNTSGTIFGFYISFVGNAESYAVQGGGSSVPSARGLLPIHLLSFNANIQQNNNALLTWITASEQNNARFILERSADGLVYKEIASIAGAGNSNKAISYSTIDKQPLAGTNYYRLKQVDFDGKSTYSNVASIVIHPERVLSFSALNPNPTNGNMIVDYNTGSSKPLKWAVNDILGRIVAQGTQANSIGMNQLNVDLSNLDKGTYYLVINNDDVSQPVVTKIVRN